jgi:hypothetical protein
LEDGVVLLDISKLGREHTVGITAFGTDGWETKESQWSRKVARPLDEVLVETLGITPVEATALASRIESQMLSADPVRAETRGVGWIALFLGAVFLAAATGLIVLFVNGVQKGGILGYSMGTSAVLLVASPWLLMRVLGRTFKR